MEIYHRIIEIIDANLVYCLIPAILTLMFVDRVFIGQFKTKKALSVIRWFIILYTLISYTIHLVGMLIDPEKYAFIDRATGPYAWAYWLMFFGSLILPLTLFFQKLGQKFWYVLIVAFFMKFGMFFERFVILVTSFHRDYRPANGNMNTDDLEMLMFVLGVVFLQGILIAMLILSILKIIDKGSVKDKSTS